MKVLMVSNNSPSKEKKYAGVFVVNQFECLQKNYQEIVFERHFLKRKFTGVLGSIIKYSGYFTRLLKVVRGRHDVIHFHFLFPNILLLPMVRSRALNSKIIFTMHGNDLTLSTRNWVYKTLTKRNLKYVDTLIAVGTGLAEEFERHYQRKVDYILPAGIDRRIFYPQQARCEYDFIFVGSFYKDKGIHLLVKAIERLVTQHQIKPSFCFIGSGPQIKLIKGLESIVDVQIIPEATQQEVSNYLNQSRFLVFPTLKEAFGLVISEAMFCGIPVISTPLPGPKMQIKNGIDGYLLEKIDVESLAQKMLNAYHLSNKSYEKMKKHCVSSNSSFALDRICENLVNIYTGEVSRNEPL